MEGGCYSYPPLYLFYERMRDIMHKEVITYTDYNGVERTESFLFNLTESEITEMELGVTGGFVESVNKIIEAQNTPALVKIFKDIICKTYGEKSPDGREFVKVRDGKNLYEGFMQTPAYDKLFMKLATDSEAAAAFINGVVPAHLREAAKKAREEANLTVVKD